MERALRADMRFERTAILKKRSAIPGGTPAAVLAAGVVKG
jgi:hypothetical protein